jgi:hypothetical protein
MKLGVLVTSSGLKNKPDKKPACSRQQQSLLLEMEALRSSETSEFTSTELHGVISQKTEFFALFLVSKETPSLFISFVSQ